MLLRMELILFMVFLLTEYETIYGSFIFPSFLSTAGRNNILVFYFLRIQRKILKPQYTPYELLGYCG